MEIAGAIITSEKYNHGIPGETVVESVTHEWKGGDFALASREFFETMGSAAKIGDIVDFYPFRVVILEYDAPRDAFIVRRTNDWRARLRYAIYQKTRRLDQIYHRIIITLAVWGLVEREDAYYRPLSWHDIKIFHRRRK